MIKISLVGLLLLVWSVGAVNNCANPPLIIPDTFLDSIFDTVFQINSYQQELRNFITNPNMDTARTYITTQSTYLITLWTFAGLSLVIFVAFTIQLCCFNCCGNKKCGKRMTLNSYTPTSVTCSVYLFMFFSLLLIAITIASFIIASDLLANLNDTTCDINATFNYLFDGTPTGYSPQWSGADNFNSYAQKLSINFPNTMPTLNTIFQSSQYTQLTSNSTSLYTAALTYNCNSALSSSTVDCPFTSNTLCANGSPTQIPAFSQNFCNANVSTSSQALINGEESTNTTSWRNALVSLQQSISSAIVNPVSFSNLVSQTSTLSGSIQNLKPGLASGIDAVNNHFYQSKIGSYIFFSIIIGIGFISFLASCCVFCTRNFNCRYVFYPLWILFTLLAIIFCLASSVLLFGSFTVFGSCLSYDYYTGTSGAFQTISYYNSSQITQILNTCFSQSNQTNITIFNTFNQTNLPAVEAINSSYYSALPSPTFTTVVNTITNTLGGYAINPNTVSFVGASSSQNPQAALDALNQLAGNCAAGSTFQYNPISCNPNLVGSSCFLISNNNTAAANISCTSSNYQSLLTYGNQVQTLSSSYINDVGLQNYRNAYFNYYQSLSTFMNSYVQALFTSFLQPYQSLLKGSSCSFLTDSLNSLVNTSCNRDFPQMYSVSILVTAMAGCFFFMMILTYFLTTRLEFYAFLNGDLSNYNEDATDEEEEATIQIEMADLTNRTNRKQLLTPKK